jgi:sulfide:quinone oxidoreductase
MNANPGQKPKVTVVGSGFGGLETAFYLRSRLGTRVDLTVVAKSHAFLFKPNTIYIPFGKPKEELVFELAPVFDRRHIRFVAATAEDVDPTHKTLITSAGPLPYDDLVIATGAAMHPSEIPGLAANANTIFTPAEMERLGESFRAVLDRAAAGTRSRVLFLVPQNNMCSGPLYEMVLMLDTWLRRKKARAAVHLGWATYEHGYIQAFGPRLNDVVTAEFADRGIAGRKGLVVRAIEPGRVFFADGSAEAFDVLVSFPPYVAAQRFAALPSDDRGFLRCDARTRQVEAHPDIYAVGDAGDFPIKQAFLALLQADAVGEHIAERLLGEDQTAAFDPVSMCIMEQLDKATFAQVPLRLTGNPAAPVVVREGAEDQYRVGSGVLWRIGKKMLGTAIPQRFLAGKPFHAGPTWATMDAGLKVMEAALTD